MRRNKVILIGVVFFVTIFLFIWGYSFLKGKSLFSKQQVYYAVYENVGGLNVGSVVTFKGFKVGVIESIEFSDDLGSKVIVTFFIDKDFRIPKNSKAQIFNADLFGSKGLRINPSESKEYYIPGDTIVSSVEVSMIDEIANNLGPLKNKTEELVVTIDTAIRIINRLILNNEDNLNTTIANIGKISSDFTVVSSSLKNMMSQPNGKLQLIISDLESLSSTLKDNEPQLTNAIKNLSNISDSLVASNLKSTILNTSVMVKNLNEITQKINNGEGTMGQLIVNDSLYNSLEDLSNKLNFLVEDIQLNPRKYLRVNVLDFSKNTNK